MTSERKILGKLFGPVLEDNQWRIRTNVELNYRRTSTLAPLFNSNALDGWDIYNG
jgi:hypothetical protein